MSSVRCDLVGDRSACGLDCAEFVERWQAWWREKTRRPLALLDCDPGYLERLDRKSQNMVRRAQRAYTYRPFAYNDHLDGIFKVNTSAPARQGRPMSHGYTRQPAPTRAGRLCVVHRDTWFGGFDDHGELRGYARLERLNEIGILNTILGERGATAVVNGLIAYMAEHAEVRWINYLTMPSSSAGLTAFKASVGFKEVRCR